MSKAGDIAKVSAKSSFDVLWGLVASAVISAVGTIFIARLLGSDLFGLYAIVLIGPNLIMIFRDLGVRQAMIHYAAQYRAEERTQEIRSIFISGLIFEIAVGLALTITSFVLSGYLAVSVFNRPAIAPLIQIASFAILAGGLISLATAAFTGTEKMHLNSIMFICQAIIKTTLIISLVILGLSTSGAVIGYMSATVMAGLLGMLLMWTVFRRLPKPSNYKLEIKAYTKEMLKYGIPLSLSVITLGFLPQFYTFMLPIHYIADNSMIGNYGIANNFVVLIGFVATPITMMLFPAFSKLDHKKDKETLQNMYQSSIKYASLLVVPVATLIMALSEPAISTLFGATYQSAPLFLALLAVTYLYTALGNLSNLNLLNGQGQTKLTLKLTLLNAAIGLPMGTILILQYGVMGLLITTITAGLPSLFVSIYWIRKLYGLTIDWNSSAKILFSSALTATLTYAIVSQLGFPSWIRLLLGTALFFFILLPTILVTKTLTKSDLNNLKLISSGLGQLTGLINRALRLIEKSMNALDNTNLKKNNSSNFPIST
jgi:O-antigen/teichoic acid export membrane protein